MEIKHGEYMILSTKEILKLKTAGVAKLMKENGMHPYNYHEYPAGGDKTMLTDKARS